MTHWSLNMMVDVPDVVPPINLVHPVISLGSILPKVGICVGEK